MYDRKIEPEAKGLILFQIAVDKLNFAPWGGYPNRFYLMFSLTLV